MQKGGKFRLVDAPPELGLGPTQLSEAFVECDRQFIEIIGATVGQCVVHLVPDALVGIEFRCIRREPFQVNPREATTELTNGFTLVGFPVVPYHDDMPAQMAKQVAEELADLGLLNILAVKLAIQPKPSSRGTDGHGGNSRDLVVLVRVMDDGSLPTRPPRTADRRDQEVSGFINKGDMGTQPRRPFFMRGQSRCFHASIAASSRCVARFSGFWQVHSSAWRSRPTWSR